MSVLTSSPSPTTHPGHASYRPARSGSNQTSSSPRSRGTYTPNISLTSSSEETSNAVSTFSAAAVATQSAVLASVDQSTQTVPSTTDASTQYTPPDYPPTSTQSSLRQQQSRPLGDGQGGSGGSTTSHEQNSSQLDQTDTPQEATAAPSESSEDADPPTPPEPGPQLGVTPQVSLSQNASGTTGASRRPRQATSTNPSSGNSPHTSPRRTQREREGRSVTYLPADYSQCNTQILSDLISDMLMELILLNDEIPLRDGLNLTRFHSRAPPAISVRDYLRRLTLHATLAPPILLSMIYLIDKLCLLYPAFTITSLTVHRFLITAATVASKGLSDSFWTNNAYARVGGVSVRELAILELELLTRVQWRIVPSPEGLEDYYRSLVGRSTSYAIENHDEDEDEELSDAEPQGAQETQPQDPDTSDEAMHDAT